MKSTLRIAMLNAEHPVPVIAQRYPTFGRIFHALLSSASASTHITSHDFDVLSEEYPASLSDFDAIIVSGSASSAYDDTPWIHRLSAFLIEVYENHPRIKFFGACFGHQIICQALLGKCGARVELDPSGWEIGIQSVSLTHPFQAAFRLPESKLRMQFLHADHVLLPKALPPKWMVVGETAQCAVQGVYEEGRVLTLQGHFEFDVWVNRETVEYLFNDTWEKGFMKGVLGSIEGEDDARRVAGVIVRFLAGEKVGNGEKRMGEEKGLDVGVETGIS